MRKTLGYVKRTRSCAGLMKFCKLLQLFRFRGARPQTRTVIEYVNAYRARFGVEPILAVLNEHGIGIAPSTYYAHTARGFGPSETEISQAYLANKLFDLWVTNRRVYGRRKLWKAARRAGFDIGRDQVERLMKIVGITGIRRGRRICTTTPAKSNVQRHGDFIERRWDLPWRPDQWWIADLTYVWTATGFCYVSFVTDVFSRRILGWRVWTSMRTELVTSALNQALFTRRRTDATFTSHGLVHHSDAGSQGGFNWLSQHLDEKGVSRWLGRTGVRRPVICPWRCVVSGVRIGRCGHRCAPLGARPPRGWCSV